METRPFRPEDSINDGHEQNVPQNTEGLPIHERIVRCRLSSLLCVETTNIVGPNRRWCTSGLLFDAYVHNLQLESPGVSVITEVIFLIVSYRASISINTNAIQAMGRIRHSSVAVILNPIFDLSWLRETLSSPLSLSTITWNNRYDWHNLNLVC